MVGKIKSRNWTKSLVILTAVVIVITGGYISFSNQINSFFSDLFGDEENEGYIPNPKERETSGLMPSQEIILTPKVTLNPTLNIITPTPDPNPIEISTPILEVEQTLDEKMRDFLDKKGNFTEEKLKEDIFSVSRNVEITKFGLMNENGLVQGYFFDYIKKEDSLVLVVGFDGNKDERFVTGLEIPLYYFEEVPKANFSFFKRSGKGTGSNLTLFTESGEEEVVRNNLDQLKGEPLIFSFELFDGSINVEDYDGFLKEELTKRLEKFEIAKKLMISIPDNNIPFKNLNLNLDGIDEISFARINDMDDIYNIEIKDLPYITLISFSGNLNK